MREFIFLPILAFAACCAPSAVAQTKAGAPILEASPAEERSSSPKAERIETVLVGPGELKKALSQLRQFIPKTQEPLNIIFGPGAESQPVPQLELRNVTGTDALMLIAAAANLQVEPIRGLTDPRYIGFRISQRLRTVPAQSTTPAPQKMLGDKGGDTYGVGALAEKAPRLETVSTQIYPIAEIATLVSFDELSGALHNLLKQQGVSADKTELAFHEKTGVLVVRGSEEAQTLVQNLLKAVERNHTKAKETSASRELEEIRQQLRTTQQQRDEMKLRLQSVEEEMTRLKQQLQEKPRF